MKIVLSILGVILLLLGVLWILQGLNVLLGSPMSGNFMWAINGLIVAVIGATILGAANRRGGRANQDK